MKKYKERKGIIRRRNGEKKVRRESKGKGGN